MVRQSPIGEADRVLTMLSPERGQVRAVAKGVRRSTGRLTGHLELLSRASVSIAEGRSLDVVVEAQCLSGMAALREDLGRLAAAMYVAELADAFSVPQEREARDPNARDIYGLLTDALSLLEAGAPVPEMVGCVQARLLAISGLAPELGACVECGSRLAERDHAFSPAAGGVVCPDCVAGAPGPLVPAPVGAIKVMRHYASADLGRAVGLRVPEAVLREVGRVLRAHLARHLDREPRSGRFLEAMGGMGGGRGAGGQGRGPTSRS